MACGFHILNSVPTLSHRALSNFNRMSFIHFLLCEIKRKSPYFQMFLASTKNNLKMLVTITFKSHAKASFVARKVTVITGVLKR